MTDPAASLGGRTSGADFNQLARPLLSDGPSIARARPRQGQPVQTGTELADAAVVTAG